MRPIPETHRLSASRRLRAGRSVRQWLTAIAAIVVGSALLVFGLLVSVLVLAVGLVAGLVVYGILRWKLRGWRGRLDEAARRARVGRGEIIDVQVRETDERGG